MKSLLLILLMLNVCIVPKTWATWRVETGVSTTSARSNDSFSDRQYDYGLALSYDLNSVVYSTAKISRATRNTYGYQARFGMHDNGGYVRPYAETWYESSSNSVGYNTGINFHIGRHLAPFVELDNGLDSYSRSVVVGSVVNFNKHFYVRASYEMTRSENANNTTVAVGWVL